MASGPFGWDLVRRTGGDDEESDYVNHWKVTSVAALLIKLKLPKKYAKCFAGMDLAEVMTLDETNLKEIGVPTFGARRRLAMAFTELKLLETKGPGIFLSACQAFAPCNA